MYIKQQNNFMKISNFIPSSKFIILFLTIALFGGMYFSYIMYESYITTKRVLTDEKNFVIADLNRSKDSLEIAISENSLFKSDLIIERQKVNNLLDEINSSNIDIASLFKYKKEVNRLKNIVTRLTKEKFELKNKNEILKIERDSTVLALGNAKKYNDTLANLNKNLNTVVNHGAKIAIVNLQSDTHKLLRTGNLEPTDKARKAEVLQVSFLVVGNKIAKACEKAYEIQIIDSKNNIVGKKLTKRYGNLILDYSFTSYVKFKNETIQVVSDMEVDNLEKGTYFVNVFDNGELASKTSFALR